MIDILHLDAHIAVCIKPAGVLSQDGGKDSMPQILKEQLQVDAVYPVHRLDKAVGGVMVYALSREAAAVLSRAVQERTLDKTYLAVLRGVPQMREAVLEDLLFHDKMKNKTYVADRQRKGVKAAKLAYETLKTVEEETLVKVRLFTGRTHQIRVQFASRKLPLAGDGRYGGKNGGKELGLWSYGLSFGHPATNERMTFTQSPPATPLWQRFAPYHKESE